MTKPHRQHGIGSLAPDEKIVGKPGGRVEPGVKQYGIFKKIKKIGKKVLGSKLGKAALIGGGLYGLGKLGAFSKLGGGTGGNWLSKGMGWGKNLLMGRPDVVAGKTMASRSAWTMEFNEKVSRPISNARFRCSRNGFTFYGRKRR